MDNYRANRGKNFVLTNEAANVWILVASLVTLSLTKHYILVKLCGK
jgi:hypothetical protein